MALRMVSLNRAADGRWFARKGIPEDVRDEYARLYGYKREARLNVPADAPRHEAKTRLGEWEAEIETRIATLRAKKNGEGQPLTKLNAIALTGRWYNWFVRQHEADPGPAKGWEELENHFVWNMLYPEAPDSYLGNTKADPPWKWSKEPDVREAVRPQVAELARVATFLASEGVALNSGAYALFVDAVQDNFYLAVSLLKRRANGDYSRDETPDSFPEFTEGLTRGEGISCWNLFEGYVTATQRASKTVSRWRAVFLQLQKDFADTPAHRITEELGIAHRVLNILVPEIRLKSPRVVPFGGQRKSAGVPQHMRMGLEGEPCLRAGTLDHSREARRGEGRPALAGEDKRRLRLLLPVQPPQHPQFVPEDRMGAGAALLDPADVQGGRGEVDLIPAQVGQFAGPQAVAVGHKDHRGVTVAPSVSLGGPEQPLDFGLRQVLAPPQVGIWGTLQTVRFTMPGATSLRCDFAM
jgi:hypothetical protein